MRGPRRQRKPGLADASHPRAMLRCCRVDLLPEGAKPYLYLTLGMSSFLAKASKGKRTALTAPHHGAEVAISPCPQAVQGQRDGTHGHMGGRHPREQSPWAGSRRGSCLHGHLPGILGRATAGWREGLSHPAHHMRLRHRLDGFIILPSC